MTWGKEAKGRRGCSHTKKTPARPARTVVDEVSIERHVDLEPRVCQDRVGASVKQRVPRRSLQGITGPFVDIAASECTFLERW